MLKIQNFWHLWQAHGRFFKQVGSFLSIAVFREFQGCEKLMFFEHYS